MDNLELAQSLFKAFEDGDEESIRSLCAPDLQLSRNGSPPFSLDALVELALGVKALVPDLHYENAVRGITGTGFVEEHDACGTLPDGSELRLAACVVGDIAEGRVISLREYLDSAAAEKLLSFMP